VRTLETFEYDAQRSVDLKQIGEFATSRWTLFVPATAL